MKNIRGIRTMVERAGGTVEEDTGYRDMRVFQVVAPSGKLWAGNDTQCVRVEWATGNTNAAITHNNREWERLVNIVLGGLRPMDSDEVAIYAED